MLASQVVQCELVSHLVRLLFTPVPYALHKVWAGEAFKVTAPAGSTSVNETSLRPQWSAPASSQVFFRTERSSEACYRFLKSFKVTDVFAALQLCKESAH